MMNAGLCNSCKNSKTNMLKELCEHCLANTKRIASPRKRYSSSTSTKSGISGLSAETYLTSIDDDEDEVECDGPGSDYEADGEQDRTEPKTINFDLESSESLTSKRYVNPTGLETHRNCQGCSRNRSFPSFNPAPLTPMQRTRLIEHHQNQRKRTPRTRRNVSESEVGSLNGRRFSADDEHLIEIINPVLHDTFVQVDEHPRAPPRTYLARIPSAKSDPNLQRVYTNKENLYDSVQDNDSGYVQNNFKGNPAEFIRNNSAKLDNAKDDANQSQSETCLQTPRKFIIIIIVTILVSWAPVAILAGLLVSSVHNKGPGTTTPPTEYPGIEEYVRGAIDRRYPGSRISSAPLRLEGTGLTTVQVKGQTHFRFNWNVAEHFVQKPLSLHSDKVMINVNQTGYYFVFCRIYYIGEKSSTLPFTVQQSLYKVNGDPNHQMLDSVSQHCMMMDNPQIEHTSTLETMVHLTAGSQIYIRLGSDMFINKKDFSQHVLGIFLLS